MIKTILKTGATVGIGLETAQMMVLATTIEPIKIFH